MQAGEGVNTSRHHLPLPGWALRMDELTERGTPYLFILDFEIREPIIIPLSELQDSKITYCIGPSKAVSFAELRRLKKAEDKHSQLTTDASTTRLLSCARGCVKVSKHSTSNACFDDAVVELRTRMCNGVETQHKQLTKSPIPFETYLGGFEKVRAAIQAGDTYLLNLCYSTRLTGITSLEDLYEAARAPYKLLLPGRFVLFSPEQFVSISDGIIRTFPMKGTMDAAVPDAEATLLADVKEQEEHATVVDLLRNDLSIVAKKVMVNRYRYISEIKTHDKVLLQCSSEISGELREVYHHRYGSLMHAILPAGSVTGAPKKRTVEIIKDAELEPRGYYTGVFGVFDGVTLDSAVMIRMIEQREDGYYYRSGGGITYRSRAEDEYQEMIDKVYVPVS